MKLKENLFKSSVNTIINTKLLRKAAIKKLDRFIFNSIMNDDSLAFRGEKIERYHFLTSLMKQASYNLDKGFIKPEVTRKMVNVFAGDTFNSKRLDNMQDTQIAFKEKYGDFPPKFLVLSPGKGCNLRCTGCYASSNSVNAEKLDFETSRRIIREAHDIFGSRFMVISGGEPLLYKSDGKTIMDLFEEFSDMFFLVYTNGTLLTEKVAQKLADLGNVTPAISVEGFELETDTRRGRGVYNKILKALANLRKAGVPFGISVTSTSLNAEMLTKSEFYDFFFKEQGATYMWQFQLMPIGRGKDVTELMVTPQQRVKLYRKWEKLLSEDGYPVADFWNSASISNGCIAYGRWGGYFYIDWNGNIMPCVFVPYHVDNIKDIYAEGKTLAEGIQSRMFKNGRKWQKEYGFDVTDPDKKGNVLMPCSIRDHFQNFKYNILTPDAKGEDEDAEIAIKDPNYEEVLKDYDEELEKLTSKIFEEKFLNEFQGVEQ